MYSGLLLLIVLIVFNSIICRDCFSSFLFFFPSLSIAYGLKDNADPENCEILQLLDSIHILVAGHGSLSLSRLPSVRKELLQFLLEDSSSVSSNVLKRFDSLNGNFPNLCYLLFLDTEATLDVLRHAFPEQECETSYVSLENLAGCSMEPGTHHFESLENQKLMAQSMVNMLISILDLESDVIRYSTVDDSTEVWPSAEDVGHLLEFIGFLLAYNGATISERVLKHILEYLTSHSPVKKIDSVKEEKQVVSLLKAVPQTEWAFGISIFKSRV